MGKRQLKKFMEQSKREHVKTILAESVAAASKDIHVISDLLGSTNTTWAENRVVKLKEDMEEIKRFHESTDSEDVKDRLETILWTLKTQIENLDGEVLQDDYRDPTSDSEDN